MMYTWYTSYDITPNPPGHPLAASRAPAVPALRSHQPSPARARIAARKSRDLRFLRFSTNLEVFLFVKLNLSFSQTFPFCSFSFCLSITEISRLLVHRNSLSPLFSLHF
jgi:hypothetical protein